MLPLRNPADYRLVVEKGTDTANFDMATQWKKLRRLVRIGPIPEGFEEVTKINGHSVYNDNGILLERYTTLKRVWNGYI